MLSWQSLNEANIINECKSKQINQQQAKAFKQKSRQATAEAKKALNKNSQQTFKMHKGVCKSLSDKKAKKNNHKSEVANL